MVNGTKHFIHFAVMHWIKQVVHDYEELPEKTHEHYQRYRMQLFSRVIAPFMTLFMTKNLKLYHSLIVSLLYTFNVLIKNAGENLK